MRHSPPRLLLGADPLACVYREANNSNEAAPGAAAPPSFPALPLLSVLPDATPASLLAYFASTFARTIVAEYDDDNIYTRDIVPLLSRGLPSAEGGGDVSGPMSALLHASYSMSCTHSFNLGRQSVSLGTLVDEEGQLEKLQQLAKSHATSALTMLRTSKAAEGDAEPVLELELRGAAVMMLVLQAVSRLSACWNPTRRSTTAPHNFRICALEPDTALTVASHTSADVVGRLQAHPFTPRRRGEGSSSIARALPVAHVR